MSASHSRIIYPQISQIGKKEMHLNLRNLRNLRIDSSYINPMRVNQVLTGDCVKLLAKMPAASVDLAFADPPFNIGYEYDQYDDRRQRDDYLAWADTWLQAVARVLKPAGAFFLAIGDEYVAEHKIRLDALGLTMRN